MKEYLLSQPLGYITNTQHKVYFAYLFFNCWNFGNKIWNCWTLCFKINKYLTKKCQLSIIGTLYIYIYTYSVRVCERERERENHQHQQQESYPTPLPTYSSTYLPIYSYNTQLVFSDKENIRRTIWNTPGVFGGGGLHYTYSSEGIVNEHRHNMPLRVCF